MFTTHELFDLYWLISRIRADVKDKENIYILRNVVDLYRDEDSTLDNNRLRKLMISLNICEKKWYILRHENRYSQETGIAKNIEQNTFLITKLDELKELLIKKNYKQAYDLADVLHMYPDIIAKDWRAEIHKSYLEEVFNSYEKKWGIK
ncbi:MAG: hypothetical protein FWH05_02720 [Oscillospiraceae bacterium]|nr:hypothetical protein [Oscillospiraceae bacterium]